MSTKALCVGINEFTNLPMASWLAGCVNDAEDISAVLQESGFAAGDITVLTDAEATKAKVMDALTSLVDGAQEGDRIVFSFSSHGTQITDVSGDEKVDGMDEAFACYDIKAKGSDWDPATVIVDDELKDLFGRVKAGVLVEVLLDTCHSGSGLRAIAKVQRDLLLGRRPRFIPPPSKRATERSLGVEAARAAAPTKDLKGMAELGAAPRSRSTARPVLFTACKSYQTAADAHFDDRPNGAFTYLFLKALKAGPQATRAELLKSVTTGLKDGDFEQRSSLEGALKAKKVGFGQTW